MKKINTLSPGTLLGMEFNIPLFQAKKQMYKCGYIEDTSPIYSNQNEKSYTIEFDEIPMSYSVPQKIRIVLIIKLDTGVVGLTLFELRDNPGKPIRLSFIAYKQDDISTLAKLKNSFYELGNKI